MSGTASGTCGDGDVQVSRVSDWVGVNSFADKRAKIPFDTRDGKVWFGTSGSVRVSCPGKNWTDGGQATPSRPTTPVLFQRAPRSHYPTPVNDPYDVNHAHDGNTGKYAICSLKACLDAICRSRYANTCGFFFPKKKLIIVPDLLSVLSWYKTPPAISPYTFSIRWNLCRLQPRTLHLLHRRSRRSSSSSSSTHAG